MATIFIRGGSWGGWWQARGGRATANTRGVYQNFGKRRTSAHGGNLHLGMNDRAEISPALPSLNPYQPLTLRGRLLRVLSASCALWCAGHVLPLAAQSATGVITGQVSNTATGANLQGARVQVAGVEREVVTDSEGRYELTGLAP